MKKLFITAAVAFVGIQATAKSLEFKSDSRALFFVNEVKDYCKSEFLNATRSGLKILEVKRLEEEVDGKSKITSIMKTGYYAHPLTGPEPQVFYTLNMVQVPNEGPFPADGGRFYSATCELTDFIGNKINLNNK